MACATALSLKTSVMALVVKNPSKIEMLTRFSSVALPLSGANGLVSRRLCLHCLVGTLSHALEAVLKPEEVDRGGQVP
jgi:hypothetical protein